MSILEHLIYFVSLLMISYLIVRAGWKLRYLAPLCFFGVFILVWLSISIGYSFDGRYIQFFSDGKFAPNSNAMDILFAASGLGGVATFLLVLVVWAIRNDVF
ncbi:hypothetical protein [Acinetobacter populi]|uniref:Uncharacterized protein n=1 Tax=Acinetobacter populi TaxID=1582270 RepID=A0A1Z9Z1E3_9GAMM|nr:hypothetical protein [Acinetobacter populi]OUY08284.1 hypothetical protein CAP51_01285 [Acinetobacter populi]